MRAVMAIIAAGTIIAGHAAAAPSKDGAPKSDPYQACLDQAAGVTVDMHNCAAAEFGRRDGELNGVYRQLQTALENSQQKDAYRKAQRAWIPFRDAECEARASNNIGGSIWPVIVDDCEIQLTVERTAQLRRALEDVRAEQSLN